MPAWIGLLSLAMAGLTSRAAVLQDGALKIEVISAYNLVVDSNIETPAGRSPTAAHLGVRITNSGTEPLTGVVARIGDLLNPSGFAGTPGIYPVTSIAPAARSYSGDFSLKHEGGAADATRVLPVVAPGETIAIYWLVSYPVKDANGKSVAGANSDLTDDLQLRYDVWVEGYEGGDTLRRTYDQRTLTCRSQLSAMANKIWPNTSSKVPKAYLDAFEAELGWRPDARTPRIANASVVEGIWYDLGRVNQGFDNDGDLVPDYNAWMQPVGDASQYDATAHRLVKSYGILIVKLNDGTERLIPFEDQLYFKNLPPNNTGVVGLVFYEFVGLRDGVMSRLSPYQEVASGRNNEKFNADYGAMLGFGTPTLAAELEKTATERTAPGGTVSYAMKVSNSGDTPLGSPEFGLPLVVTDFVPAGIVYVAGSAEAANTLPSGVGVSVWFSTGGGSTWLASEPVPASSVNALQWRFSAALPPEASATMRFQAVVPTGYVGATVDNCADTSIFGGATLARDCASTLLDGVNSLSGTVFRDIGAGVLFANGVRNAGDAAETGIEAVRVSLYWDTNGDGLLDAGALLYAQANSLANGTFSFGSLPDGRYVVVVDPQDSNVPFGYSLTTPGVRAVALDPTGTNPSPVAVGGLDFGFAPTLTLGKTGPATAREGGTASYTLTVRNRFEGTGTGSAQARTYTTWASVRNATLSGATANKQFINDANAYSPAIPDGQYATTTYVNADELLGLQGFTAPAQSDAITNVLLRIPISRSGSFRAGGAGDRLIVRIFTNNTTTASFTTNIVANTLPSGTSTLEFNVTSAVAWNWNLFNGSAIIVQLDTPKGTGPYVDGVLGIDQVGFRVTSSGSFGTGNDHNTLNPVPLHDTYDPSILQFLSATPPPTSVTMDGPAPNTGHLFWENVGPLYPGGTATVSVTFAVLEPSGNLATLTTNTAVVAGPTYASGSPAATVTSRVETAISPAGTIGNFVWRDLNGNGIQDGGAETGIAGVSVVLTPPAGVNLGNGAGNSVSTVTDASGYYLFSGIPSTGSYTVTVLTATLPGGSGFNTWDRDGNRNSQTTVTLDVASTTGGDKVLDADFGYNSLSSVIRGSLWHDMDQSGTATPDAGEPLLGGVTVRLYDGGNNLVATTTTSADGTYRFVGAYNGTYSVRVDSATGPLATGTWSATYDSDGTNTLHRSDVAVPPGGLGIADFSYVRTGTLRIGDSVFYDWDGNGSQGTGEEGIPNVTVRLYRDANSNGIFAEGVDPLVVTAVTDVDGQYLFQNLAAGTYFVVVDGASPGLPASFTVTSDPYGALDGFSVVTLVATDRLDQDFGYQPLGSGSIGDTVWYDRDVDGVRDAGEPGLPGIGVSLYVDMSGDGNYVLRATTQTGANGNYLFGNLPAGSYRVVVDTTDGNLPADSFGTAAQPTTSVVVDLALADKMHYLDADFGFGLRASIGDFVFFDANANGTQDASEAGIPNVRVWLYSDPDGDGDPSDGVLLATVFTADGSGEVPAGYYRFEGLDPYGSYVVRVDPGSLPIVNGLPIPQTADPDRDGIPCGDPEYPDLPPCDHQTAVTLRGSDYLAADFGYRPGGVIGDFVWLDLNGDGVQDSGEAGLAGVLVDAVKGGDTVQAWTDGDGYYSFANLEDGTWTVRLAASNFAPGGVLENLAATYDPDGGLDNSVSVVIVNGAVSDADNAWAGRPDASLDVDFGLKLDGAYSLSGNVFLSNSAFTPTATNGVGGVSVYLYLADGTYLGSAVADAAGNYSFEGLPDGNYRVVVDRTGATLARAAFITLLGETPATAITEYPGSVIQDVMIGGVAVTDVDYGFERSDLYDFGDLPARYGFTTIAQDGARHLIPEGGATLWLGITPPDGEPDGLPSDLADGDDEDGLDDEDGVAAVDIQSWADGLVSEGAGGRLAVTVSIPSGQVAYLAGWLDLADNGSFADASDWIIGQNVLGTGEPQTLEVAFDIPAGTITAADHAWYGRFRLFSSTPSFPRFAYSGAAVDGEVEDHRFWREGYASVGRFVWNDLNSNGLRDPGEPGMAGVGVSILRVEPDGEGLTTNLVSSTVTDDIGYYRFDVPPGTYVLKLDVPAGYSLSPRGDNESQSVGNGFGPHEPYTDDFSVMSGELRLDLDGGLYYSPMLAVVTSFAAELREGVVVAQWEVSEQFDTWSYVLQRRVGTAWVDIGTVDASPWPMGPFFYELQDPAAAPAGTHTWRLIEYEGGGGVNVYGPYTVSVGSPAADFDSWADGVDWNGAARGRDDDPDGDGLTNYQEFLAGTDPLDADSLLKITALRPAESGNGLEIRWPSVAGRVYRVAYARTLAGPFTPLPGDQDATPPQNRFVLPGADSGFFRVILKSE